VRLLALQRQAGNRAAAGLLAGRLPVQRCGPVPCDCGPAERAAAEADPAPAVQRLHQDFYITGKLAEPKTDRFHFDRASAVLDAGEVNKAAAYDGKTVSELRLRATVSEDEDPQLATDRIVAVEQALLQVSNTGPAQRDAKPLAGRGNKDYRLVRRVMVFDTTVPPTGPDCSQGAQVPCPAPNPFTVARDRAGELIKQALAALAELDAGPARQAMETYFRGAENVEGVTAALTEIAAQLPRYDKEIAKGSDAKGGFRCYNECDPVVADNEGLGPDAIITVGPRFLTSADTERLALTILHEASHGAPGLKTDDHAYEWQRLLPFLGLEKAVKNADSYAGLVGAIIGRPIGNTVGPDQYAGISEVDERGTTEMLGWLEQYVVSTRQEIGGLHRSMNTAIRAVRWQTGQYRNQTFAAVGAAFPEAARVVADPATPPTADHVATVAGCYDRLSRLHGGIANRKLTLTAAADDQVAWEQGATSPGAGIQLPASFFGKSGLDRLHLLLDAMLAASGAIEPGRRAGYRQLILARGALTGSPG
jgi:Lysine-specific metallo-endopeptidase